MTPRPDGWHISVGAIHELAQVRHVAHAYHTCAIGSTSDLDIMAKRIQGWPYSRMAVRKTKAEHWMD